MENKFWQEFSRSSTWSLCQGRWAKPKLSPVLTEPICVFWDSQHHTWLVILPQCFLFLQQYNMLSNGSLLSTWFHCLEQPSFIRMRATYWSVFAMLRITLFSQYCSECSVKGFLNTDLESIWKYMKSSVEGREGMLTLQILIGMWSTTVSMQKTFRLQVLKFLSSN